MAPVAAPAFGAIFPTMSSVSGPVWGGAASTSASAAIGRLVESAVTIPLLLPAGAYEARARAAMRFRQPLIVVTQAADDAETRVPDPHRRGRRPLRIVGS